MQSQDGVVQACGENLTEAGLINRIAIAVDKIVFELSGGAHEEFASASKGPEEL